MAIGGLLNQCFLHSKECLESMSHHIKENKKYIRELYSHLPRDVISATIGFNLIGDSNTLEQFKNIQRDIASDIFGLKFTYMMIKAIFAFHPVGIQSREISNKTITHCNSQELNSEQYKEYHKKYYHELASLLVESGVDEIKKDLHPEKDKMIIQHLDFTVNLIRKIDYRVEKIINLNNTSHNACDVW